MSDIRVNLNYQFGQVTFHKLVKVFIRSAFFHFCYHVTPQADHKVVALLHLYCSCTVSQNSLSVSDHLAEN